MIISFDYKSLVSDESVILLCIHVHQKVYHMLSPFDGISRSLKAPKLVSLLKKKRLLNIFRHIVVNNMQLRPLKAYILNSLEELQRPARRF